MARTGGLDPHPGNHKLLCFLRNTEPPREAIGSLLGPTVYRGRSVLPSVKYVDD